MTTHYKKILVFGKNGQLATALNEVLPLDTIFIGQEDANFGDSSLVLKTLDNVRPDLVINTAAYTQVDFAQTDEATCTQVNATTPQHIANWCVSNKCFFIHISTDYVFDGKKSSPYIEKDLAQPVNIYGSTKLLGEQLIEKSGCHFLILRTSWLYHESGQNFIKTMLKLSREKKELKVVTDQISSPTYAGDLAQAILNLLKQTSLPRGIYHICNSGYCSRLELMEFVLKHAKTYDPLIQAQLLPAKTSEFPTPASRPLVTMLNTDLAKNDLNITMPNWQEGVMKCLKKMYPK